MSSIETRVAELEEYMLSIENRVAEQEEYVKTLLKRINQMEQDRIPTLITEKLNKINGLTLHDTISKINGLTLQDKLNTLNKCQCCDRHQISRPKTMSLWIDTYINDDPDYERDCTCPCRHYSRMICRQFKPDTIV